MRGGKRTGAGRKPAPPTEMYFIRLPVSLKARLQEIGTKTVKANLVALAEGEKMEANIETRKYSCGCIDSHNSSLISSQCVDHCDMHAWDGDRMRERDENPAACDGYDYVVE